MEKSASTQVLDQRRIPDLLIEFRPERHDSNQISVLCRNPDGTILKLGRIFMQGNTEETIYHSITDRGDMLCRPTDDFNEVEYQFDLYAKLLITERELKAVNIKSMNKSLTINNQYPMKNPNNNPSKGKKENQLIYIEYEKPTKDGHLITVVDSYHNTLGRIHRSYNEETKKYEFSALDHAGKPFFQKTEKVWELKNEFTKNRESLLKQAHERRLEAKAQRGQEEDKTQPEKDTGKPSPELPARLSHYDMDLTGQDVIDEEAKREDELDNLREQGSGRDSNSFER